MLKIKKLTKKFLSAGEVITALDDVSFNIKQGDFISIAGSSGSGKTTLLNILAGFMKPTTGSVEFEEKPIHKMNDKKLSQLRSSKIGFIYQSFNLIPRLTVFENIRAPLFFEKEKSKNHRQLVKAILKKVGISEKINDYPLNLSGGQQQRVAIARALIKQPAILMADEPTGNLDAKTGKNIINLFKKLNKEGITILVVTHDERFFKETKRHLEIKFGKLKEKKR